MLSSRIFFFLCCGLCASVATAADSIRTNIEDAKVVADEAGVVIVIKSKGIGGGLLHRTGDKWPARVAIWLDVRGLEGFHVRSGDLAAQTFLGSREPEVLRIGKDNKSTPVTKDAEQYSPTAKRLGKEKVEVILPPALLGDSPQVKIHWVDFYRG